MYLPRVKVANMCVCVCFLYPSEACVRIRIRGEKTPELLLKLQDDDRTQTFLTQVKSAQEQGKTPLSVCRLKQKIHYLITHLIFSYWVWITPLTDFLCLLPIHTLVERLSWLPFLKSDLSFRVLLWSQKGLKVMSMCSPLLHLCFIHATNTLQINVNLHSCFN